jgi:transposase-like protein
VDMGRFLIETHLRTGRPLKELARSHDVSASWLFTLWRRYRLEGEHPLSQPSAQVYAVSDVGARCLETSQWRPRQDSNLRPAD